MQRTTNVFISGVGGQGILLASEILSDVALAHGLDVKKSEVHGMAQRGGSVVSHVRFGEKVYSPVIAEREADLLVSFEKMEALRWIHYIAPEGTVVINDQQIVPSGMERYPEDIDEGISKRAPNAHILDALALANEAGNARAVNTVRGRGLEEGHRGARPAEDCRDQPEGLRARPGCRTQVAATLVRCWGLTPRSDTLSWFAVGALPRRSDTRRFAPKLAAG